MTITFLEYLLDAPRNFSYTRQKDDGSTVEVRYTIYPPSPAGEANNAKILIALYNEAIQTGDYMMFYGNYGVLTKCITIALEGDSITTYPDKPY